MRRHDLGIPANNTPAVDTNPPRIISWFNCRRRAFPGNRNVEDIDGLTVLNDVNGYAVRQSGHGFDDVTGTNNPDWPYGISRYSPLPNGYDLANNTGPQFHHSQLRDDGHDFARR